MTVDRHRIDNNNGGKTWGLWGISLYGRGVSQVLKLVEDHISSNNIKPFWMATVNTEFVMEALKDRVFFEILKKTDLNVMDGIGLVWARELELRIKKIIEGIKIGWEILRGEHRESLVPGVELMDKMCEIAARTKKSVYFFGGWGDRAARTAEHFRSQMSDLRCQSSAGEPYESNEISLKKINDFKPDFLFVARGMKKQEFWINENLDKLKVKVVMGVGRSFDYFSGDLKRAPRWVRRMGLEWLYSLYKEPKRWRRQLALPAFILRVLFGK